MVQNVNDKVMANHNSRHVDIFGEKVTILEQYFCFYIFPRWTHVKS